MKNSIAPYLENDLVVGRQVVPVALLVLVLLAVASADDADVAPVGAAEVQLAGEGGGLEDLGPGDRKEMMVEWYMFIVSC